MKRVFLFIIISGLFFGCSVTKGIKNETVKKAINLQDEVIKNPLFKKIILELEATNDIDWSEGRTNFIKEDIAEYKSYTHWLIEKYESKGVYDENSVFLWRKFNPFSSTTAVTTQCVETTKLNKWKLKRDEYSILNTLIHERVHSFCQVHPNGKQTRDANVCDASYVAGDLAEILVLNQMGIKERVMNKPICPALKKKVEEYNLIEIK
ncbi:hypothetical protein C7H62_0237 [Mesoflavibacter sp. HG96]|uniref:hypothetical protein n=1 Tax=Mesoflavibacter TaxID=444051 RepID=UPI000D0FAB5C|nr:MULTISPECIES: hypothetical protein [Mesoflavibacter]QIJ88047.1 hypothetical protein C7H62_0237 [Mesoflavibacter sp. HG96]QIJ90775.1 hypothetical protein C7H56_0237 [Mesoflavibacter sp. HG37]